MPQRKSTAALKAKMKTKAKRTGTKLSKDAVAFVKAIDKDKRTGKRAFTLTSLILVLHEDFNVDLQPGQIRRLVLAVLGRELW